MTLRSFGREGLPRVQAWYNDGEVRRFLGPIYCKGRYWDLVLIGVLDSERPSHG